MARIAVVLAIVVALATATASASAATYYVTTTGSDANPCTQAAPCATIGQALIAHRASPTSTDIISVGAGTFTESAAANDAADDGLTVQGTLGSGGSRDTTLKPNPSAACSCALQLGLSPDVEVTLRDLDVDGSSTPNALQLLKLNGGSDLIDVEATGIISGGGTNVVSDPSDPGTTIDQSDIEIGAAASTAIVTLGGLTVLNSHVAAPLGSPIRQFASASSGAVVVRRSWLEAGALAFVPALGATSSLTLDSSLVTGGFPAVHLSNFAGRNARITNSTLDAVTPGVVDGGVSALLADNATGHPRIDVTVDSSIVVEGVGTSSHPSLQGPGSVTCTYSDLLASTAGPPFTVACATGGATTNTTTDPANLFVGGSPFDWRLQAGAPAIDTGRPGQVRNGQSPLDLDGNPRVIAATSPACPGIRDKGAYETTGVLCVIRPPVIEHAATPAVGQKLAMDRGEWSANAVAFDRQWMRCDSPDPSAACVDIAGKTRGVYTPTSADVGKVLRVRVVAHDGQGGSLQAVSDPSAAVIEPIPEVKAPPWIEGSTTPHIGVQLRGHHGQWTDTPSSYTYEWLSCDPTGNGCSTIPGATAGNYTPAPTDNGHTLRLRVVAHGAVGDSNPATSAPTGVVT